MEWFCDLYPDKKVVQQKWTAMHSNNIFILRCACVCLRESQAVSRELLRSAQISAYLQHLIQDIDPRINKGPAQPGLLQNRRAIPRPH